MRLLIDEQLQMVMPHRQIEFRSRKLRKNK